LLLNGRRFFVAFSGNGSEERRDQVQFCKTHVYLAKLADKDSARAQRN
jgi:hypothetical protein